MPEPRLSRVEVKQFSLRIPLEDFEVLPRELGCCLHRHATGALTLATEQAGCALRFEAVGADAALRGVSIEQDPEGVFVRDVLGLLVQLYSGDLEATLTFEGRDEHPIHVEVRQGETSHPLLFQPPASSVAEALPDDHSISLVERALREAEQAYAEYQALVRVGSMPMPKPSE